MDFDELYKSVIPTKQSILELVDEYTLYCYYTNIDPLIPGKTYTAPYRIDDTPSFSVFPSGFGDIEFMWKDHAEGVSGTIFHLIQKIEVLDNVEQVLAKINEDFQLGYDTVNPMRREKITLYNKPERSEVKISIIEQPFTQLGLAFWNQFRVDKQLLEFYKTSQVQYYWKYIDQQAPHTAPDPMFSYRIGEYHQLYAPYLEKKERFRNDLPENYFFGYLQLPKTGDTLIIDKSCKDVIFCRRLGFWAVCGKSETTMIPHKKILELKERFKNIYLTLDNDKAGMKQTDKYLKQYPFLIPKFLQQAKDKTDLCKLIGFEEAERVINKTIYE